ncbi:hypothetical protein [Aeromicrobium sp. UC242_57]|uniref:hypothetical protein n=1 Tax=Aeromicrobium sp. UC242_57 TaxID=3374624 RepID=UPI0037B37993
MTPRNAAPSSADAHRLPNTSIVSGNNPANECEGSESERRRVTDSGTDRSHDPLGPHSATTSFAPTGSLQAAQVSTGEKSLSHSECRIVGSVGSCRPTDVPTPRSPA